MIALSLAIFVGLIFLTPYYWRLDSRFIQNPIFITPLWMIMTFFTCRRWRSLQSSPQSDIRPKVD